MRKAIIVLVALVLSIPAIAQLEVKEDSFKEVPGFVNINTEKMYDDNEKPYAVIKIRTENINNKQRRELVFEGNAATFFELEYKVGEIWVYISYYATFIKISHPDLSSTEFWFPFDMEPKKGYELTLINKPPVDEELVKRIEKLEGVYNNANVVELDTTPEKQLNGIFSVGKYSKVYFSQGNLQYRATTDTWRFAENQWDYIGEGNKNISYKYDGWIDLFGYGTSGYDYKYKPYTLKISDNDGIDEDITGTNYDWGVFNAISNGGKEAGIWRVLSKREWNYLFNKRVTKTGMRYIKAKVNGVNGVILFPDDWEYTLIFNDGQPNNFYNRGGINYNAIIIDKSEWVDFYESNGAVFLPAAGTRGDNRVNALEEDGCYWSGTDAHGNIFHHDEGEDALNLFFDHNSLKTADKSSISNGFSVRLVRDVR